MKQTVLDLSNCKYALEMHERFKTALNFPEHYGRNWDAFWDCIMCDSSVEYIEIYGENSIANELRPMLETLHEILEEAKEECIKYGEQFDYVIVD
jgi:RNAse (barnase) inhibitor barstar